MVIHDDVLLAMAGRLGWTALHYACERGQLDTARLLLCYNADGSAANVYGESPMHYAASGGQEALVGLMATQAGHTGRPTTRAQVRREKRELGIEQGGMHGHKERQVAPRLRPSVVLMLVGPFAKGLTPLAWACVRYVCR